MATKNAVRGPRPVEMDASLLFPDIIEALRPYQCGCIKPEDNAAVGFPKVNSLVLTEKELAHYDTPETGELECYHSISYGLSAGLLTLPSFGTCEGVYVACDGIIYDIGGM